MVGLSIKFICICLINRSCIVYDDAGYNHDRVILQLCPFIYIYIYVIGKSSQRIDLIRGIFNQGLFPPSKILEGQREQTLIINALNSIRLRSIEEFLRKNVCNTRRISVSKCEKEKINKRTSTKREKGKKGDGFPYKGKYITNRSNLFVRAKDISYYNG